MFIVQFLLIIVVFIAYILDKMKLHKGFKAVRGR